MDSLQQETVCDGGESNSFKLSEVFVIASLVRLIVIYRD